MSLGIIKEDQTLTYYSVFHMRVSDIHDNVGYLLAGDSLNIRLEGIENIRDTLNKERFILCAYEEADGNIRYASGDVKTAVVFGYLIDIGVKCENILVSYTTFSGKPAGIVFDIDGRPRLSRGEVKFNDIVTDMMLRQTLTTYSLKKMGVLNNFQNKQKMMDIIDLCTEKEVYSLNKDIVMHELIKLRHNIEASQTLSDKVESIDKSIRLLRNSTYTREGLSLLHNSIDMLLTRIKLGITEDVELADILEKIHRATLVSIGTFVVWRVSKKRDEERLNMSANLSAITGFRGNAVTYKKTFDISKLYEVNGFKEIIIHGKFICNELNHRTLLDLQQTLLDNELHLMSVVRDTPMYGDTDYMVIFTQNMDAISIINKTFAGIYEISDIRSNL